METDPLFNSTENQAFLVVCARKTIRNAAILGIVWGGINLVLGFFAVQANPVEEASGLCKQLFKSIKDANKRLIRVVVRHPLGKLTCAFDQKNSEKIKGWLSAPATQTS
jgi:hypothetical protein